MATMQTEKQSRLGWKVRLDDDVCQGYACCVMAVPSVFDLDEATGKALVTNAEPDDSLRADIDGAIRGCPVRAISVEAG